MTIYVAKGSTPTILIGPLIDTNGDPVTGLTLAQADILLWKAGGTSPAQKNDATSATDRSNGMYTAPLNATDTGTEGVLSVIVNKTGALPFRMDLCVLPAKVHASMVAGSDNLEVDAIQLNGSATAGAKLATMAGQAITGVLEGTPSATSLTVTDLALTYATADQLLNRLVYITSGTYAGKGPVVVEDYAASGDDGVLTVSTLGTAVPSASDTILIL
jgi:hypothetical protein